MPEKGVAMTGTKIQTSPKELEQFSACLSEFSCGVSSDCDELQRAFEKLSDTLDEESKQIFADLIRDIREIVAEQEEELKNLTDKVHKYSDFLTTLKKTLVGAALGVEMKEALNASKHGYETTHGYRVSKLVGRTGKALAQVNQLDALAESQLESITDGIGTMYDVQYAVRHPEKRIDFSASEVTQEQIDAHTLVIDPKDM